MQGTLTDTPSLRGILSNVEKLTGVLSKPEAFSGKFDGKLIRGASAYELAVKYGYKGTEEEWVREMRSNVVFCDSLPPDTEAKVDTLYVVKRS